jgi:hypothetical protein
VILSQPHPQRTHATRLAASVAVAANHLALLDLSEDALPASVWQRVADVEVLIAKMVKLEHNRIGFPAVDARVPCEVLD